MGCCGQEVLVDDDNEYSEEEDEKEENLESNAYRIERPNKKVIEKKNPKKEKIII